MEIVFFLFLVLKDIVCLGLNVWGWLFESDCEMVICCFFLEWDVVGVFWDVSDFLVGVVLELVGGGWSCEVCLWLLLLE